MTTPLCSDCPDHEACMTGYPCDVVRAATTPPAPDDQPDPSRDEHTQAEESQ